MVKLELKRALFSRAFAITTVFGFVMMMAGRYDQSMGIFGESEPYLSKFLNSFAFTPLLILWPITVMLPFVLSYRKERDSGYERLMVLKAASWRQYREAKIAAVALSSFLSLFLPMTGWLLFCKFILGSGEVVNPILFMPEFAESCPFLYGMMYSVNAGVQGAVFAVLGLGLSAVIRNKYLALLLPVCYCVFTGVAAPRAWEAFKLIDPSVYSNPMLGGWGILVYDLALLTIGCILFIGGDHYAGKA